METIEIYRKLNSATPSDMLHYMNLRGFNLSGMDLSGLDLRYSDFTGARLFNTRLSNTRLEGARLINVKGLTREQLDAAITDDQTVTSP